MTLRFAAPRADLERIAADFPVAEPFHTDLPLLVVGYVGAEPIGLIGGDVILDDPAQPGWVPYAQGVHLRLRPGWLGPRWALPLMAAFEARCVAWGLTRLRCVIRRSVPHARTAAGFVRLWGCRILAEDAETVTWGRDDLTGRGPARLARRLARQEATHV